MRSRATVLGIVTSVLIGVHAHASEKAAPSGFDRIKQLAGDWKGTAKMGDAAPEDITVSYKVTAGGSAVVETIFKDTPKEMVTVYYQDGDDLVLKHYCMLRNQPRMKAAATDSPNKIAFKFAGCENLASEDDAHMHEATMEFPGDGALRTTWVLFQGGKAATQVVVELKRVK